MRSISAREGSGEVHRNNLFGVYVAPMSAMMVVAWVATTGLRWSAARFSLTRYVSTRNAIGAALRLRRRRRGAGMTSARFSIRRH
jgi:hypothetical protein